MNCFDFSTPFKRLERNATALSLNRPYSLKVEKSQRQFLAADSYLVFKI